MFVLDPTTTGFVAGVFAVGLAAILWISRIGLGAAARGVRMWLLGDVVLIASRYVTTAETNAALWQPPGPAMSVNSALIIAGVALHWMALRRHVGVGGRPMRDIGAALGLGLAMGLASASLSSVAHRGVLLHAAMMALFVLQFVAVWNSARRFSGARVLAGAFVWGFVANTVMLSSAFEHTATSHERAGLYLMMGATMTLVTAAAFLLWLQQELRQHFMDLAVTDALTGVLNRRGLMPRLEQELSRARRSGQPVSVALCDLDHFKRVNDVHGHDIGDQVIRHFADTARTLLRQHDLIARWGGEEFLIVLPDTSSEDAVRAIDRLRRGLAPVAPSSLPPVTVSAGVVTAAADEAAFDLGQLLRWADERLYAAKTTRDTVIAGPAASEGAAMGKSPVVGAGAARAMPVA